MVPGRSRQPWCSAMSPLAKIRNIGRDRSGVSAVEFALIFPVLAALFMGMVQIASMVQGYLTNSNTAHLVADLVGRCRAVIPADITDDLKAAAFMLNSTSTLPTGASAIVASVNFDASTGAATVGWSQTSGPNTISTATILSNVASLKIASPGHSLIVVGITNGGSTTYGYAVPRLIPQVPMLSASSTGCN